MKLASAPPLFITFQRPWLLALFGPSLITRLRRIETSNYNPMTLYRTNVLPTYYPGPECVLLRYRVKTLFASCCKHENISYFRPWYYTVLFKVWQKKVQRGHERTEEELVFKLSDKEQFSHQGCVLPQSILPHVQHHLVLTFKSYNERDAILK